MTSPRLDRSTRPAALRPVRIVHVGIGNFSRAHQAWYTMAADAEHEWGICAFTGRRADVATALAPQQGLYTLIERGPQSDRLEVVEVLSEVHPGGDLAALTEALAAPATALVTLTVTEAGYRPPAAAERAAAGASTGLPAPASSPAPASLPTPPERLARGLVERHRRGNGPLALISCDNLHANGAVLRERVLAAATLVDPVAARWIEREVAFVSTSVDRITPRTTDADRELVVRELGLADASPVVTEPFSDWILSGEFPAGRPRWELAGARFVGAIEPWELRKLWVLNGGHSLLAYLGLPRGHRTVAQALRDPELAQALEQFWDLVARHLPGAAALELDGYRRATHARFANARMGYPLEQIAGDGLDKLRNRVVPVTEAALAADEPAAPALRIVRAWARWLIEDPARAASDQNGELLRGVLGAAGGDDRARGLLELLSPGLADRASIGEEER